jgi:hypothetical protein
LMYHAVDGATDHHITAAPCRHPAQVRQHDAAHRVEQFIGVVPPHQHVLLFHQAQRQHFGFDPDMIGVGLRSRRPPIVRAQVPDVAQPGPLIEQTIAALHDHSFRHQPRNALPCASQVCRQTVGTGTKRVLSRFAARSCVIACAIARPSIWKRLPICDRPQRHCNSKKRGGEYVEGSAACAPRDGFPTVGGTKT